MFLKWNKKIITNGVLKLRITSQTNNNSSGNMALFGYLILVSIDVRYYFSIFCKVQVEKIYQILRILFNHTP